VERRFGDEDLYIARGDDRHKKVALWRVRRGQERRGRRESPVPVSPARGELLSPESHGVAPVCLPPNPAPPLATEMPPPDDDAQPAREHEDHGSEEALRLLPSVQSVATVYPQADYRLIHDPDSAVVFCHCWRQCNTLRPSPTSGVKGQMSHAASYRGACSHRDRPRGPLSGSL
jgi:hypothetical protein